MPFAALAFHPGKRRMERGFDLKKNIPN